MIHLNTAGAGLMPAPVTEAMHECLRQEATGGAYETELRYDFLLGQGIYRQLAARLNAPAEDIALFDSATRAWCSVVELLDLGPADRVWVTPYEYAGNLISLFGLRERTGCRIEVIPTTPDGDVDLAWLAAEIDDDVALVSVTHIPSGCGIVNPVAAIGRLLAPYRCWYAVDGCQSVGQVPTDVAAIGCQLFTGAGRKFLCGPRGTGFAYVAPELRAALRPGFRDLHVANVVSRNGFEVVDRSARVLELAERTTAAVVGLSAALAHPTAHPDPQVYQALRAVVAELPGLTEIAPGTVHSGLVSFRHEYLPAEGICQRLREDGVNTWPIHGNHTPLYLAERGIDRAVRASVHGYTTADEVAEFGRILDKIIRSGLA